MTLNCYNGQRKSLRIRLQKSIFSFTASVLVGPIEIKNAPSIYKWARNYGSNL